MPTATRLSIVKQELLWALLLNTKGVSPEIIENVRRARKRGSKAKRSTNLPPAGVLLDMLCFSAAGLTIYDEDSGVAALAAHACQCDGRTHAHLLRTLTTRLVRAPGPSSTGAADSGHMARVTDPSTLLSNGTEVSGSAGPVASPQTLAPSRDFRDQVLRAARSISTDTGHHLVLISRVWRELNRHGSAIDLPQFKAHLLVAYRCRDLTLSKEDMPETLDPGEVVESCVDDQGRSLVYIDVPASEGA